jgi:hypothetical protein
MPRTLPVIERYFLVLSCLAFAACGPSDLVGKEELKAVSDGMPIDSVIKLLGKGSMLPLQPSDSVRLFSGFRTQRYLAPGGPYRVLWYRKAPGELEDQITRESDTPILFDREDRVIARGWSEFDDKAADLGIPNPYRAAERLDSISKSQLPRP